MSERTVNDNNKLWEAAERAAEQAVLDAKAESTEERRKQKKRVLKLSLLMIFIALIIVFASIAWFAMNKAVTADTMAIEAAESPFEIAVKGDSVRIDDEFKSADSTYEYGNEQTYSNVDYRETGGIVQKIKIRYNPGENDPTEFGPDSSGQIDFYVVPKQDGTLTVRIDLDTIGFREFGEGNNKAIKRISELTSADVPDAATLASYQEAENYLKGHIMFFENKGNAGTAELNQYYYKDPITSGYLTKTFENAKKNEPKTVTIYWMWTNTLGQIALKNTANLVNVERNGLPIVADVSDSASAEVLSASDKGKVIQYLKDNKTKIFKDVTVTDTQIDNAKTEANFNLLSTGYNNADFAIGSCISYFMIDIAVSKAG